MLHSNSTSNAPPKASTAKLPHRRDPSVPKSRPSAIPRSTSGSSTQRLEAVAAARSLSRPSPGTVPAASRHSRIPSEDVPLFLESSLTRKEAKSSESDSWPQKGSQKDHSKYPVPSGAILGIVVPDKRSVPRSQSPDLPPQLIPELQALASHTSRPYPSLPSISTISSPSTRFTESPAPWSASTATTTPVSMSSSSPAHMQTAPIKSKTTPQLREPRSRLPKLTTLPSGPASQKAERSTMLPAEPVTNVSATRGRKLLPESRPSFHLPEPSSSLRRRERSGSRNGTSSTGQPSSTAATSTLDASSLAKSRAVRSNETGASSVSPDTSTTHARLQNLVRVAPSRPSREGTTSIGESRPVVVHEHRTAATFNTKRRQLLASAFEDAVPTAQQPGTRAPARETGGTTQKTPSKLSTFSRLGMFSRKSANISVESVERPSNKLTRRGPAAGTGHEGYGKYAKRGRKLSKEGSSRGSDSEHSVSSVSSVRSSALTALSRKSSDTSSRKKRPSQSELDDFASSRMQPVILRGGSETSVAVTDASGDRTRVSIGTDDEASSGFGLPRASSPVGNAPKNETSARRTSSGMFDQKPGLALRRSQRFGPGYAGLRIPSPIKTDQLRAPLYVTSQDTSQSSLGPSSLDSEQHNHPQRMPAVKKKSRRHWWNPFHKSQQVSAPIVSALPPLTQHQAMAVNVESRRAPRPVPYYAVMESESENNTTEAIGEVLAQAAEPSPGSPRYVPSDDEIPTMWRMRQSALLPSTPKREAEEEEEEEEEDRVPKSPTMKHTAESGSTKETASKQSRLAQVGRIPKVVSRVERKLVPSRRSFSQPFGMPNAGETPTKDGDWRSELPRLETSADVLPSRPFPGSNGISSKPESAPAQPIATEPAGMEWYVSQAPPVPTTSYRKSDVSSSSSSSGMVSVMGPPLLPLSGGCELPAAGLPSPRIAIGLPGDDEVWNEYDDFLDHVMTPPRSKERTARPHPQSTPLAYGPPVVPDGERLRPADSLAPVDPRKAVLDLPFPPSLTDSHLSEDVQLRRSRIRSALQSHSPHDPSSPFSMREFLREYTRGGVDGEALSERAASSSTGAELIPSVTSASDGRRIEHATHDENVDLLESKARARNPGRQSELHYASLEVSRWLSFGRVLFSPAHEEIRMLPRRNVLVIDGLGNEDWSIYCAVTYEKEGAVIYDLKEDSSSSMSQRARDSAHTPMNHHRRSVASLSDRFPFPGAFFCAIVLRFPPAMSEVKMKGIIGECRRVLEPGGHLEIIMLELDIVNMGVQTRRAVRELKMGMTDLAPDVDLKPTIDNFQTVLGGCGFTGLRRCIVGVPVTGRRAAGSVESSSSSSFSSARSSGCSIGHAQRASGGGGGADGGGHHRLSLTRKDHNFSLNDLVADHSEKADSKIGRLVSRTARSWWQHCYEADVLASRPHATSVLSDRRVIQECKARGSSFKLLIAHAQRPVFESRRRTMSEPAASAWATAGGATRSKHDHLTSSTNR